MNIETKMSFNILMMLIVVATWYRMVMVFLVLRAYSTLIVTIGAMLGSGLTFLLMLSYY